MSALSQPLPFVTPLACEPAAQAAAGPVQMLNPVERPDWDALVESHPDCSFFHSAAWARVLHDTYGYTPACFTVIEGGRLQAMLPMMEVNSWLTGRRGISLPFTDHCEPIGEDAACFRPLLGEADRFARSRGWRYLEWRGGTDAFPEAPAYLSYYGHALELSRDEKQMSARLDSSVRRAIRKAETAGVTVEYLKTSEAVRTFYQLHCKTRKRHGLPPQPFRFFANIQRHVLAREKGFVVLARCRGIPIAAAIFFHSKAKAIYKFGASDNRCQLLRGNNLLMWDVIQWYARRGFEQLHFGRTSLGDEGLRRFKLGWGTQEHRIDYVRYDLRKDEFETGKDESVGWYNQVFHALPSFVARMIGACLYRHIA